MKLSSMRKCSRLSMIRRNRSEKRGKSRLRNVRLAVKRREIRIGSSISRKRPTAS